MVTIKYINGKTEKIHRYNLTPTGVEMRNTSADTLREVLNGDGRRLLIYERDDTTRIIIPNEIRDILINDKSVFIEKDDRHRCGVWCDRC